MKFRQSDRHIHRLRLHLPREPPFARATCSVLWSPALTQQHTTGHASVHSSRDDRLPRAAACQYGHAWQKLHSHVIGRHRRASARTGSRWRGASVRWRWAQRTRVTTDVSPPQVKAVTKPGIAAAPGFQSAVLPRCFVVPRQVIPKWPFVILGVRGSCRVAMIKGSPGGSPSPNCAR